jgi:hypothetical protein
VNHVDLFESFVVLDQFYLYIIVFDRISLILDVDVLMFVQGDYYLMIVLVADLDEFVVKLVQIKDIHS